MNARLHRIFDLEDTVLDYAADNRGDSPFHLQREQLYYGDEHSVVARSGRHLGQSMTAIFRSSFRHNIRFRGFKAAKKSFF